MNLVSDHGFPTEEAQKLFKQDCEDALAAFKNERDYIAQGGRLKTTVAAMDWAILEIERRCGPSTGAKQMSEPTEAMVEAGVRAYLDYEPADGQEIWSRCEGAMRAALTAALALLPETERWWQKFEDAREFVRILWRKKALSDHEYYALVALIDTAERSTHWRPLPAPPPAEGQKG